MLRHFASFFLFPLFVLVALGCSAPQPASAQEESEALGIPAGALPLYDYHVTDLGLFTQTGIFDATGGINIHGVAVGSYTGLDGNTHGFVYQKGAFVDVGGLGGTSTICSGINDFGIVVGQSVDQSGTPLPFVYNGTLNALPLLPNSNQGGASAINNKGIVVGYSFVQSATDPNEYNQNAVLWNNGVATPLGLLPSGVLSGAISINNKGEIVGGADAPIGELNAVIFTPSGIENLGTMGGIDADAIHVNDKGQIVGLFVGGSSPFPVEGFLYNKGVSTQVADLPGSTQNIPGAIDDQGVIVGNCTVNNNPVGYVNVNGFTYDLTTLLDSGSAGYTLPNVLCISNNGQIGAQGDVNGDLRPVILTPDNTPASPKITGFAPAQISQSSSATVAILGRGFTADSSVDWGNTPLATTFHSANKLTVEVPASFTSGLAQAPATMPIVVVNPKGASLPSLLTVDPAGLFLNGLSPASVKAGHPPLVLTVNGSGFTEPSLGGPADTVMFGATALKTKFVSTAQLKATVPASLLKAKGPVNVTVTDGTNTASALIFTVV